MEDVHVRTLEHDNVILVFEVFEADVASWIVAEADVLGQVLHLIKEIMSSLARLGKPPSSLAGNSALVSLGCSGVISCLCLALRQIFSIT